MIYYQIGGQTWIKLEAIMTDEIVYTDDLSILFNKEELMLESTLLSLKDKSVSIYGACKNAHTFIPFYH